ncbi:MAG: MFS transporter [Phycisphaerae bacterium]|nr:MFS transporter [Phycisphaerae bacterium]
MQFLHRAREFLGRRLHRTREFLGLRGSMAGLLAMVILVGLGEKLAEDFLPIYLIALGGGFISVGFLNALDNLLGAAYSLPGGYLAQRWGPKRALLAFNLLAMAGFLIVILIPAWPAVLIGAVFFLAWTAISLPATMGLVAQVLPRSKRTMGVAMHSLVRRVPMALGPLLGGLLIQRYGTLAGVRLAFVAAFALAALAALLQQLLIQDQPPAARVPANPLPILHAMSPALRSLLVADTLIRFCEQIPYAFVVVWAMQTIAHPVRADQFGLLRTVEMTTAALLYIPLAYLADRSVKKPFVLLTFIFFTLFPVVLLLAQSFWTLLGAFALRGLKEFGEATRKALILDLAPEDRRAITFGVYYLVRDSIVALAAFGGAFLWQISPAANFLTAAAFGLAGTLWFARYGRDLTDARPQDAR